MSRHVLIVDGEEFELGDAIARFGPHVVNEVLLRGREVSRPDSVLVTTKALYGFCKVDLFGCTGMSEQRLGVAGHQWKCAYCGTVTAWRAADRPIAKCGSCGAPRGMGS